MSTPTTDLDQLVEQTLSEYQQYQEEKAAKEAQKKRAKEEEGEREMTALLEKYLSPEFRSQVKFTYSHNWDSYHGYTGVEATFRYQNDRWDLSYKKDNTYEIDKTTWRIECNGSQKAYGVEARSLQVLLLVELGKRRKEQQEARAKTQAYQEQWALNDAARARREQQEQEIRQRRIAEAEAVHQRLLRVVEEKRQTAEAQMWRWPEGVSVTLYRIQYCTGAFQDEEGSCGFDYSTGWTTTSELGEGGWITIYPKRSYDWEEEKEPRQVKLDVGKHHIVWTRHTFSSPEELPEGLTREVTFAPGIVEKRDPDIGEDRFVEQSEPDYHSHWYTETLGREPIAWVCAVVDGQDVLDAINRQEEKRRSV